MKNYLNTTSQCQKVADEPKSRCFFCDSVCGKCKCVTITEELGALHYHEVPQAHKVQL